MNGGKATAGWLVGLVALLSLLGAGCRRDKPKPPPPAAASAAHVPCEGGQTLDPPHHETRPAMQALRAKDYAAARRLFDDLQPKYPESASLRVWRGEALLEDDSNGSVSAALAAFDEARALDARGCKLKDRERYYLAIGLADADLRQRRAEPALLELADAARQWPESAELAYHRARAECLLGKLAECLADLQGALDRARSRQRVRYARSHRFPEELRQRAAKEPEFAELRKDPRFRALVDAAGTDDGGGATP